MQLLTNILEKVQGSLERCLVCLYVLCIYHDSQHIDFPCSSYYYYCENLVKIREFSPL